MRPSDVLQGINLVHAHGEFFLLHEAEELGDIVIRFGTGHNVIEQGGTRDLDIFGSEFPVGAVGVSAKIG